MTIDHEQVIPHPRDRVDDAEPSANRTLVLVDVGLGNIASVRNMLHRLGHEAECRQNPDGLDERAWYVLPGVGAFDEGVRRLRATGWFDHLASLPTRTPILGICLGMQLLGRGSAEGRLPGLARVAATFERFPRGGLAVPHMGWNIVEPVARDSIFDPNISELRYYFTHTYYAVCEDPEVQIGATTYGCTFTSAYRSDGTCGVQFHPEKSHSFGLSLLSRWLGSSC